VLVDREVRAPRRCELVAPRTHADLTVAVTAETANALIGAEGTGEVRACGESGDARTDLERRPLLRWRWNEVDTDLGL
jgi:hypothetical protein